MLPDGINTGANLRKLQGHISTESRPEWKRSILSSSAHMAQAYLCQVWPWLKHDNWERCADQVEVTTATERRVTEHENTNATCDRRQHKEGPSGYDRKSKSHTVTAACNHAGISLCYDCVKDEWRHSIQRGCCLWNWLGHCQSVVFMQICLKKTSVPWSENTENVSSMTYLQSMRPIDLIHCVIALHGQTCKHRQNRTALRKWHVQRTCSFGAWCFMTPHVFRDPQEKSGFQHYRLIMRYYVKEQTMMKKLCQFLLHWILHACFQLSSVRKQE